jgi:ABC-type Na+ efflux pump permease subunit
VTARLNTTAVLAIAGRDLRIVARSRAVLIPTIAVPIVLLLTPPLALLAARTAPDSLATALFPLLTRLPVEMLDQLPTEPARQAVVLLLLYVFAPLYLLVPVLVASVTAADSVVGERERGTLEGLLDSPTTDRELLIGKLLAPWGMATVVSALGAVAYGAVANLVLSQYGLPRSFPNLEWAVLVVWVAPAAAAIGLGLIVAASNRVKTFHEASQIIGIIVLPIVALVVAQAAGVVLFDVGVLLLFGAALWLMAVLLLRVSARGFRRDRLLTRD